jgi:hypothetical protein
MAFKSPEIAKYPVSFPVSREFSPETGSHLTAHTTIQSHQTADFQADLKQAVSVGIAGYFILPFRSLVPVAVSRADFGIPSPHPKIPFPGAARGGLMPFGRPGIMAVWGTKNAVRGEPRLLRVQSERLELPAPFGWRIAQPFDADASRQPTFNGCSNEVRCEES